jgi:class 3 adenylate cyclase
VVCNSCGTDAPAGNRFCSECGNALERSCPSCAARVDASAKFCAACGTDLRSDGPQPRPLPRATGAAPAAASGADRRFVSVLFADIVEYTSFAAGRDPDEVRDLLAVYFDRSRVIIEKYGGVVEKFIGDAIFGVWGTDVVREDDAERAVRAGLELVSMVAALGEEQGHAGLRCRAGVMSGSTTVGPGGNESTGMIVGDLVNTAARLQSKADPGAVFVGRTTHEVTARSVVYEPRGEVLVKGKTDPVGVWRAMRPAGRVGEGAKVRELPFAGRDREMRLLTDQLDATAADGRARLVAITGEAGIGKSRLAKEFMHHVDGYTDDVYWHQGRSPSYGDGAPMWSLTEMVRQRAGILEDEQDASARTRLRTMLAEYVTDAEDRQWIENWSAGLLGLAEMPNGSRAELLSALRSLFRHVAERGTTVLVFEDLHWADDAVVEFVTELVDRATRAPILVIALARPELLDRHPGFGSRQKASVNVSLAALSDDDMRDAISEHLGGVDTDLVDRIVERAAGYPLYAAEIIRMLTNDGSLVETAEGFEWTGDAAGLAIPDTLQAVIGARIDRLDPILRSLLQDAAVLGLTFQPTALRVLGGCPDDAVDEALRQLVRLDVLEVVDDPRSPERGQYRFVQSLIQELAYDRLHRSERRARHLAAAAYFERGDDPELAGIVAKHYVGAFDASPEGTERDELVQRAIHSLVDAARRSAEIHADAVAIDLYDRAIALATDEPSVAAWCVAAAQSAGWEGQRERCFAFLDRADAVSDRLGDRRGLVDAAITRAWILNSSADSAAALAVIEPHYSALDTIDDERSLRVAAETARAYSLLLRSDEALAACDRALPAAEALEHAHLTVDVLITRATALGFGNRPVEAIAALTGVIAVADREGLLAPCVRATNNLISTMAVVHPRATEEWFPRFFDYVRRSGVREWATRARSLRALFQLWDGDVGGVADIEQDVDAQLDDEYSRQQHAWLVAMRDIRIGAPGWDARLDAVLHPLESGGDPQVQMRVAEARATAALVRRDWETAFTALVNPETVEPIGLAMSLYALIRLGDASRLDDIERVIDAVVRGPRRNCMVALAEAVRAGLDGDRDTCIERFGALLLLQEAVDHREDIATAKASFAALVGLDHPEARRAAEEVRDWIEAGGLWGLYEAFSDVLPEREPAQASASG